MAGPNDLGSTKTVGHRGRHASSSRRANTVVKVKQARIMQGRASRERKPTAKQSVYVGVDVANDTLEVAISDGTEVRQFPNDHEGINQAVGYIGGLDLTGIILEATGHLEMPLAAALQAERLSVIINLR